MAIESILTPNRNNFLDEYLYKKINNKHLLFCPIPKCANTTLRYFFNQLNNTNNLNYLNNNNEVGKCKQNIIMIAKENKKYIYKNLSEQYKKIIINSENLFLYVFVRNPYYRLLSNYFTFIIFTDGKKFDDFLIHIFKVLNKKPTQKELTKKITFNEFVDYIIQKSDEELNYHFKSQYIFLLDFDFNFIGKIENIDDDIKTFLNMLELSPTTIQNLISEELPKINYYPDDIKNNNQGDICFKDYNYIQLMNYHNKYKTYPPRKSFYDNELCLKVYKRYEKDFIKFGYSKYLS